MQTRNRISRIAVLGVGLLAASAALASENVPPPTHRAVEPNTPSRSLLNAMLLTPTVGHPDLYGEYAGMQFFAKGDYKRAMKYFLIGARYADKPSQLSIGLMYLNGQGVETDPASAFAWVALSAERGYPQFLATRDAIGAGLDNTQREQAKTMLARLETEYGDAVAKPRLADVMRQTRSSMAMNPWHASTLTALFGASGSLSPAESKWAQAPTGACHVKTMYDLPSVYCNATPPRDLDHVQWYWNPAEYFQVRDADVWGVTSSAALKPLAGPSRK